MPAVSRVMSRFNSAIPASVLKYSEVSLSEDVSAREGRGMFYCIRRSFGKCGTALSYVYALACLLLSLVMGAALQTRSVVDAAHVLYGTEPIFTAVIAAVIVLVSAVWGGRMIGRITLIVIPLTTIIYIFLTFGTIMGNFSRFPEVINAILTDAFTIDSGVGGLVGFLTSRSVSEGFARGILSNEAGAGTSTLGHATGGETTPATKGLHGVLEVFFDTTLLCMLTAFAVLLSVPDPSSFSGGVELVFYAIESSLGGFSSVLTALCILAFAYSTVICWYYYGTECVTQLTGRKVSPIVFMPIFLLFVFTGAFISDVVLVALTDCLMLVLTLLTLPVLIKSSDRIVFLSERDGYLKLKKSDS